MKEDEIKEYRKSIEEHLRDKEKDIETTITYVTIGVLGLFLTINEKFIPLITSSEIWIMYLSVGFLVLSFSIGLWNKFKTTKFDRDIIDIIDNNDLKTDVGESILLEKWQDSDKKLQNNRIAIYVLLILGISTQLIYFFININKLPPPIHSIEIKMDKNKLDSLFDTKNNKIVINIYNDSLL